MPGDRHLTPRTIRDEEKEYRACGYEPGERALKELPPLERTDLRVDEAVGSIG
jgi:hypothetical protein